MKPTIKTFDDLKFTGSEVSKKASLSFGNGYEIEVEFFPMTLNENKFNGTRYRYGNEIGRFEFQTKEQVEELMRAMQQVPELREEPEEKHVTKPTDRAYPGLGENGLTKREYFAAQAMIGLATRYDFDDTARLSVKYADALIAALNK